MKSLMRLVELNIDETARVKLHDGTHAEVTLLSSRHEHDSIQQAARRARVRVRVNGDEGEIVCGDYRLPVELGGIQIDCPATAAILADTVANRWGLTRQAMFRCWPAGSDWIEKGTFVYPIVQRWFAGEMQSSPVPVYVSGEEAPVRKGRVYYHAGVDFSGVEGLTRVVAASDGVVVTLGDGVLDAARHTAAPARYDVIYVLDDRGWYHRYSHLHEIDPGIVLGERVHMGQAVGTLGKKGNSGGWAHLHYDISVPVPACGHAVTCAYAFLWQAYRQQYDPALIAHARPHRVARVNESVTLDASASWAKSSIRNYEWTLTDGRVIQGPTATVQYPVPGTYSEILKVTDDQGRVAYDFGVVMIFPVDDSARIPPKLHVMNEPTLGIRAGAPVHFAVRAFRVLPSEGEETWDFGDGSPRTTTQSRAFDRGVEGSADVRDPEGYARLSHVYDKSGDYLVTVQRANKEGYTATARLCVRVEE